MGDVQWTSGFWAERFKVCKESMVPYMMGEYMNPDVSHAYRNFETYNMGHLMTAACLHYRITGKKTLLDVAIKATDFLYNFYKRASAELARNAICPSHYMGIVEMYRTTRDPRYLELAKNLITIRNQGIETM